MRHIVGCFRHFFNQSCLLSPVELKLSHQPHPHSEPREAHVSVSTSGTTAPSQPSTPWQKVIFGAGVGNALEWYDWSVYAIFAPFFANQFFNPADPVSAMLATLGVFAAGFVMRPLGGIFFGWFADRTGRQ
ncbi:hypothetical protein LH612_30895, partial [Klebsiella pneumoniae]|nr:hypothetical protein [Klebsiella pneumoniae]